LRQQHIYMAKEGSREGWVSIRIREDIYRRIEKIADELGFTTPQAVCGQALTDFLSLAEAATGQRRVPHLVRALDGVRSEGEVLKDEAPPRPVVPERAGHGGKVLRVGKG
jgi:hypothetical protein